MLGCVIDAYLTFFFAISRQLHHETFYQYLFYLKKKKTHLDATSLSYYHLPLIPKTSLKTFLYLRSPLHLSLSCQGRLQLPNLSLYLSALNTASFLKRFSSWLSRHPMPLVFLLILSSFPLGLLCWFSLPYLNSTWRRALHLSPQTFSLVRFLSSPR